MGLSHCRPGSDRSVHLACGVRVYNVKLRSSSAPGIVNGSLSFQKELLGLKGGMGQTRSWNDGRRMTTLPPEAEFRRQEVGC
jgi:hypothetical protein